MVSHSHHHPDRNRVGNSSSARTTNRVVTVLPHQCKKKENVSRPQLFSRTEITDSFPPSVLTSLPVGASRSQCHDIMTSWRTFGQNQLWRASHVLVTYMAFKYVDNFLFHKLR